VVEDDYFVAVELEHRLRHAGYEVVGVAVTAEEAVQMAAAHRPLLAIMDIRLSGPRDGIDAAVELLQDLMCPQFLQAHTATPRPEDVPKRQVRSDGLRNPTRRRR
jgi:DNA-binding NarL/FixJ family response regulator